MAFRVCLKFSMMCLLNLTWPLSIRLLEIQTAVAALIESFTFELAEGVEIDPIRLGAVSPLVKGDWNAGARLPLKIASRQV